MDLGIAGRTALVGGASKGLGYGCAEALACEGVDVTIVARTDAAVRRAAEEIGALSGRRVHAVAATAPGKPFVKYAAADITTPEGRAAAFALHADYDIVVTNAGGPPPGDFRDWDRDAWLKAIDANMLTPIELIKATVDGMIARKFGRIVNITSSSVKAPIDVLGLSNGARSGLTGFVAGVARKVARHNVTINNLLPGTFDTDRIAVTHASRAKASGKSIEEVRQAQMEGIPGGRLGNIGEFGKVCAFICSVHASYLVGQNILLDGGSYPGTY